MDVSSNQGPTPMMIGSAICGARRNTRTGNTTRRKERNHLNRPQTDEDRAFVEKVKTIGFICPTTSPGHKASGSDIRAFDDTGGDSSMAQMCKDPIMFKHITEGNASDPSLKRDATAIEQERHDKPIRQWDENKRKSIKERRARYKAKYGCEPE